MNISDIPIKDEIKNVLRDKGFNKLYPTQEAAIKTDFLEGKNLVMSVPTASGKTLVAEIAFARKALEGKKTVYVVPLKALAQEKYQDFKKWEKIGLNINITTGDFDESGEDLLNSDVIVCTSEKFDSLLRHNSHFKGDVDLIVIDETHLIDSQERGTTLEMVMTHMKDNSQIIGLSATISNAEELGNWLDADVVKKNWRPVELKKGVLDNNKVDYGDGEYKKVGDYINLSLRTLKEEKQSIIFTNSRKSAKKVAKDLSKEIKRKYKHLIDSPDLKNLSRRIQSNTSLQNELKEYIKQGVAFHHAGLDYKSRDIIEEGFRDNKIKLIAATPTLAAGINMPAYRVIIRDTKRYSGNGWKDIPAMEIQQMMGRAGRPKYDNIGEAIIVSKKDDKEEIEDKYIHGDPEPVESKLSEESSLRSHILSLFTDFGLRNKKELNKFLKNTFYHSQVGIDTINRKLNVIIQELDEGDLIEKDNTNNYSPTSFGKKVSMLYIDPKSALKISKAFEKLSEKKLTEFSILHMICSTPDIRNLYLRKGEKEKFDQETVSRNNQFLLEKPDPFMAPAEYENFLTEVKTTMVLKDWIEEKEEDEITEEYSIGPGDLRRYIENVDWLIHAVTEISKLDRFKVEEEYIRKFKILRTRINNGIKDELIPLVKIKGIGRKRARILFDHGYKNIKDLKKAKPSKIASLDGFGGKIVKKIYSKFDQEEPELKQINGQQSIQDFY